MLKTLLVLTTALAALTGCGELYCQSGPKYGMQCYSQNDLELQETMSRGEPPSMARSVVPTPGCVSLTPAGFVQQPLNGPYSAPTGPYLRSAACTTNRQTVQGALR